MELVQGGIRNVQFFMKLVARQLESSVQEGVSHTPRDGSVRMCRGRDCWYIKSCEQNKCQLQQLCIYEIKTYLNSDSLRFRLLRYSFRELKGVVITEVPAREHYMHKIKGKGHVFMMVCSLWNGA